MKASQLVRITRRSLGISQRELSFRSGISQPALATVETSKHDTSSENLERLLRATGHSLIAIPTLSRTAAEWADYIYQCIREKKSEEMLFRAFIALNDDLVKSSPAIKVVLTVLVPPPCGDIRFDAAIAALVEHHLANDNLPIPHWVNEPSKFLDQEWTVSRFTEREDCPRAFQRHGVIISESELRSV